MIVGENCYGKEHLGGIIDYHKERLERREHMVNVAIHEKYFQTLSVFGDLQVTIEKAIQRYVIETISEKITELQQQLMIYQEQYGMNYSEFERRIAEDEDFVNHIERTIKKTWELDVAHWEFCSKGIDDWTRKLSSILRT